MFVKELGEVWRCEVCGNVIEVREVGGGQLICCGGPMTREAPGRGGKEPPPRRAR